ncbi:MAG: FAD-binding oxidoreductase [Deinococcales bacterium]|nr:FAD-binding oxidoreductase [Chitinophagaceae bacterium]
MNIAVIGAGISGLSTAYLLVEKGYAVTIIAKTFSPNTTSNKAAAFWFPYHVRGDKRAIGWANKSYQFYNQLASNNNAGISFIKLVKGIKEGAIDDDSWIPFMPPNTCKELATELLPTGYSKGFEAEVPLIETQIFLPYLQNCLVAKGVIFIENEITNLLDILHQFDAVINCSGLGAKTLCNDDKIFPVRGQVLLLEPGYPESIFLDNQTPTYIVPRKDATIIGGTYEENIGIEITEQVTLNRLLEKAGKVFPALKNRKIIGSWAGLRPFRETVRLEREPDTNIIHNYGHGGSGFTLAFGCADDVLELVTSLTHKGE